MTEKASHSEAEDKDLVAVNKIKEDIMKAVEGQVQCFYASWVQGVDNNNIALGSLCAGTDQDLAILMYSSMKFWPVAMKEYFLDMVKLETATMPSKLVN